MELHEIIEKVKTKKDFVDFVGSLLQDLKEHPSSWENKTLDDYLEALQRWTDEMEGFYKYNKINLPDNIAWRIFADILIAAKMYE